MLPSNEVTFSLSCAEEQEWSLTCQVLGSKAAPPQVLTWQPVAGAGSLRAVVLVLPGAGTRAWAQGRSCGSGTLARKASGVC